jgi:hypothetical protein
MKKAPRSEQFGKPVRLPPVDGDEREDPLNPAIPRAPLLPHDLHRMANAALPKWSNPPSDKAGERQLSASQVDLEFRREHVDADPPPGATPSTYESAARAPHTDSIPHPSDADHAPSEFARRPIPPSPEPVPGSGPAAITAPDAMAKASAAKSSQRWLIVVVVLVLAAAGGLWWLLL